MAAPIHRYWPLCLALGIAAAGTEAGTLGGAVTGGQARDGWLVLVGRDALGPTQTVGLGDLGRELRLDIEVTGTTLELCIYDPGFYNPALASTTQLDFRLAAIEPGCPEPAIAFEIYAPGNPVPIKRDELTYGPDSPPPSGSEQRWWCFFDSSADGDVAPGLYTLVVRLDDGPCADPDVNVFGVRTNPDYDVYTHHATVGHARHAGADLASDRVRLYPWVSEASGGTDPGGLAVCGLDLTQFDLDAVIAGLVPPTVTLTTRLGWSDSFGGSLDAGFHTVHWPNLAGYNGGGDHGIFDLSVSGVTSASAVLERHGLPAPCLPTPCPGTGIDFNAFSLQLYDYGKPEPVSYSDFPILPGDPRAASYRPRRLYLPRADGSAPLKEYVGQRIVNPPPGGVYTVGTSLPVTIELEVVNPSSYPLSNLAGATTISPDPALSDPQDVQVSPGGSATASGRTIEVSFATIPAGGRATLRYTVPFNPGSAGERFLTGDGIDFSGGLSPTVVTWDTPFASGERGLPCMILTNSVDPPCAITARASAPARVCRNQPVVLDGSATTAVTCRTLEYRWSGPDLAPAPFGPDPRRSLAPITPGRAVYSLEVRCQADPACTGTVDVAVDVSPGDHAIADTGPDLTLGPCDLPRAIGSPGDRSRFTYRWEPAALVGDANLPAPQFLATGLGSYVLTLSVVATADPGCHAEDTLSLTVSDLPVTGSLGNTLKAVPAAGGTELSWPLGRISIDRYNLHRCDRKGDLDKASYAAPVLAAEAMGWYADPDSAPPGTVHFYEVWGRTCAGGSVIE